jgi:hypothetical protein
MAADMPGRGLYMGEAGTETSGDPSGQYRPAGHRICTADDEPMGQYEPPKHNPKGDVKPVLLQYEPGVHRV